MLKKLKINNEIFSLSLLIIITIVFTTYYNFTKSKIYLGKNSDSVGDLQDVSGAYSNGVYTLTNAIATANGYSDLSALLADLYLVPEVDQVGTFNILANGISVDGSDTATTTGNIKVQVFKVAQQPIVESGETPYEDLSAGYIIGDGGVGDWTGTNSGGGVLFQAKNDTTTTLTVRKGSVDDSVSVLMQGVLNGAYFVNDETGQAVGAQGATAGIWVFDQNEIKDLVMVIPDTQLAGNPDSGFSYDESTGFIRKTDGISFTAGDAGLPTITFSAMAVDPTGSTTAATDTFTIKFQIDAQRFDPLIIDLDGDGDTDLDILNSELDKVTFEDDEHI